MSDISFKGSCHCGRVTYTQSMKPKWLVECNCSICSRLATLWGHSEIQEVELKGAEHTLAYVWGDKNLSFHTCKTCGCTTHWMSLDPEKMNRMAVNYRLCSPADRAKLDIRKFDGADTWEYLD